MKRQLFLLVCWIVGIVGAILASLWMLVALVFAPYGKRAMSIALAFDQLGNAATGGDRDETISSRAGRLRKENVYWACVLCKFLDWLQKNHCEKAIGK